MYGKPNPFSKSPYQRPDFELLMAKYGIQLGPNPMTDAGPDRDFKATIVRDGDELSHVTSYGATPVKALVALLQEAANCRELKVTEYWRRRNPECRDE